MTYVLPASLTHVPTSQPWCLFIRFTEIPSTRRQKNYRNARTIFQQYLTTLIERGEISKVEVRTEVATDKNKQTKTENKQTKKNRKQTNKGKLKTNKQRLKTKKKGSRLIIRQWAGCGEEFPPHTFLHLRHCFAPHCSALFTLCLHFVYTLFTLCHIIYTLL